MQTAPVPESRTEAERLDNDYQSARANDERRPPLIAQIALLLRGIVVLILLIVSIGLFWVVGTLLELF